VVKEIVTYDGELACAGAGDAVTITLSDEIDIGRGDVMVKPVEQPDFADHFAANLIWMGQEAMIPGRSYAFRISTRSISLGSITSVKYKVDVDRGGHLAARTLSQNEIGFCNIELAVPTAFDPYEANRLTGSFIIIDRYTNETVGAGMIVFPLSRAANVAWQPLSVGVDERAALKRQKPCVVWFTGLSGAGKSTIANLLDQKLLSMSHHTMLLDGDNLRRGLNRDLGFTEADRVENIRRAGEVAKLMVDSGLIVICSFISPYGAEREMVRGLVGDDNFIEVFVDTPLGECMRRDPKGLYSKAKLGKLKKFTGVDAPYEPPVDADVHLRTLGVGPEPLADAVLSSLVARGFVGQAC